MEIKSNEDLNADEEFQDKGEVDLEAELISTLQEIKKARKENKVLKEEAQRFEQFIDDLNVKLEEAKRIEDSLIEQVMASVKEK